MNSRREFLNSALTFTGSLLIPSLLKAWSGAKMRKAKTVYSTDFELSLVSKYTIDLAQTTYNFTNADFGAPHPNREIFIVGLFRSTTAATPTAFTIGGATATETGYNSPSPSPRFSVAFATVPTGWTGTVSVTMSTSCNYAFIYVYRVINRPGIGTASSDKVNNASAGGSTSYSFNTLTVPANGFALGLMLTSNASVQTELTSNIFTIADKSFLVGGVSYPVIAHYSRIGTTASTPSQTFAWTTASSYGGMFAAFS